MCGPSDLGNSSPMTFPEREVSSWLVGANNSMLPGERGVPSNWAVQGDSKKVLSKDRMAQGM